MNLNRYYRFLYRVGFTPWEQNDEDLATQFRSLLAPVEAGRTPSFGAALDLGCGTGRWSVELATRGWRVTGVDVVRKAIAAARQRARAAGVDVTFLEADVTALRGAGLTPAFSFLLDMECFNHLDDAQRLAMGREVNAVASNDATMLLLGWARARRGPLPPGVDEDGLTAAFPGWRIVREHPYEGELPRPLKNVAPRWYALTRS
jgi:SAM-dependent methyltransferase